MANPSSHTAFDANSTREAPGPSTGRRDRRGLAIRLAAVARWLHIYLSLLGMAVVLFFSLTGLTLNHPTWFATAGNSQTQDEGRVDPRWLRGGTGDGVSRLEVVEHLRGSHAVRGALADFRVDDHECSVSFKGPGYDADAFINRETGAYTLTQSRHGLVAILNDLHKGRDSGPVWSVLIDVSALLLTVISLTGLVLLAYLKRRRLSGGLVGLLGLLALILIVYVFVP
jgi:hypothetical protein